MAGKKKNKKQFMDLEKLQKKKQKEINNARRGTYWNATGSEQVIPDKRNKEKKKRMDKEISEYN